MIQVCAGPMRGYWEQYSDQSSGPRPPEKTPERKQLFRISAVLGCAPRLAPAHLPILYLCHHGLEWLYLIQFLLEEPLYFFFLGLAVTKQLLCSTQQPGILLLQATEGW